MKCPETIQEFEELEQLINLCRREVYEQAKARIESGAAKSVSEASRQIGQETGRSPESIRRRIIEEGSVRGAQLSEISGTDKHRPNIIATKWTGDQESYTPSEYIESARLVMGSIDLDPASNALANETVKAKKYYTKEDDGLTKEWTGNIFLNPPYSHPEVKHFIETLIFHYQENKINQAVLLTNNNTDTNWFHDGVKYSDAFCLTKGRIQFIKIDGSLSQPTNGQCFFYFGSRKNKFKEEFGQYGLILTYDDPLS